jgi:hypothetical protein
MAGAGMASVEVQREFGGFTDHLRSYKIVFDSEVVGRLRPGESCVLDTTPGHHELFLKIDWGRSEKVNLNLTAGRVARFRCAPRGNIFTGVYWATFGSRRSIELIEITEEPRNA